MTDVTPILSAIEQGDRTAAAELLPLVYDELRQLAARKLARESPGHTLQTTSLVHEAYIRLVDVKNPQLWSGRCGGDAVVRMAAQLKDDEFHDAVISSKRTGSAAAYFNSHFAQSWDQVTNSCHGGIG